MKVPVYRDGVLAIEEVKDETARSPIAALHETQEGSYPVASPVMDRQLAMDEAEGKPSSTADEPMVVLYKCDCGRFLTDSMIAQGECAGHIMRHAVSMTDEESEDLAVQLEAMSLETTLTENENVLLKVIRSKLAERWM